MKNDKKDLKFNNSSAIMATANQGLSSTADFLSENEVFLMKQKEMALWLRGLTIFSAVAVLAFGGVMVPLVAQRLSEAHQAGSFPLFYCVTFGVCALIPAYLSLWNVWCICGQIASNNSFSKANAVRLRSISQYCIIDAILFLIGAAGLVTMGHSEFFVLLLLFAFSFFSVFLSVVTAALSHLTEKASLLKTENDLTI